MLGYGVKDYFRTIEVSINGFDGVFHDVLNTKGCCHMEDDIGFGN